jgi:hypothetical protein
MGNEVNCAGTWLAVAGCLLISTEGILAKVSITEEPALSKLANPSFGDAGDTPDRAAGWNRWGDWFNREEGWTPVRSGSTMHFSGAMKVGL